MAKVITLHKQEHVDKMVLKDRIQATYATIARERGALKRWKKEHGFCTLDDACMNKADEGFVSCGYCYNRSRHRERHFGKTEYGKIRAKEREEARREREAAAMKKAVQE